ncbi:hypothetical protein ACR3LR_09205 [Pantoea eucalypti]|uniref:hypothetical protein n=1 Tax=Pantoea eucalypti TaxID=470933 RepID=UPI003EE79D20
MKQTIVILSAEGLFTSVPALSGVEDIIGYLLTRESYGCAEDADGEPVKRYRISARIEAEEID